MSEDLAELAEEECLARVQRKLDAGQDSLVILEEARRGPEIVGQHRLPLRARRFGFAHRMPAG